MFKLMPELATVPGWFQNFHAEKLYQNEVPSIRHLIWVLQIADILRLLSLMSLAGSFGIVGLGPFFAQGVLSFAVLQATILGIQARSRLAWLLVVGTSLTLMTSWFFPVGLLILYFLEQDASQEYFTPVAQ